MDSSLNGSSFGERFIAVQVNIERKNNLVLGSHLTVHQADNQLSQQTEAVLSLIMEDTSLVVVMTVDDSVGSEAEDAELSSQVIAAIPVSVIMVADRVTSLNVVDFDLLTNSPAVFGNPIKGS